MTCGVRPPRTTPPSMTDLSRPPRGMWSGPLELAGRVARSLVPFLTILFLGPLTALGQSPDPEPPFGGDSPPPTLEQRLDALESSNRNLVDQVFRVEQENARLRQELDAAVPPIGGTTGPIETDPTAIPMNGGLQPADLLSDPSTAPSAKAKSNALKGVFDEGFKWKTEDGEYDLQFHQETQLDVRAYGDPHPDPVNRFGFYIARMRFIFNGHLTKPIEYNVSINKGTGSLDLLDAYLNFNYDKRFQFRFGRYRVPYTYDWYALSNQFLVTPERSVFAINYGYNRNFAAMLHGELLDEEVDYAIALATGPRNSYFDTNADKDLLAYLNIRPFRNLTGWEDFQNFQVGGSMAYGSQNQDPLPVSFRTSANASESPGTVEGVPAFLELNGNVTERGLRELWELHAAWYWQQLSLLGAWDHGFNTYGFTNSAAQVRLPTSGYHVQVGYFLTGEEVERRTFVEPLRPFDPSRGLHGPGAIELAFRYDHFQVGQEVFSQGLANPADWTNQVDTTDIGVNWYLNKYVKIDFDWQHSSYGRPVTYAPGRQHTHSDLFWTRFQIYF